jgi:PAS domain S-box-containing protein
MDDLYAKRTAIDHVHDGVAWVTEGRRLGYLNPSLARMLDVAPEQLIGRSWFDMFAQSERGRVAEAYSQMLLAGKATLDVEVIDSGGRVTVRGLLMVAVHDHKMRLAGHHCILHDHAVEEQPEEQLAFAGRN